MSEMNMAETMSDVVKSRCRCGLNASCEKKYCSMTSLQTKSSKGSVVNMFKPKQKRATLIKVSVDEKLFRMLPCVLSVNTRKAEIASVQHATSDSAVEMWVTVANRSNVGVFRLP